MDGFGIGDSFVLVYSISLVDCVGWPCGGFRHSGWFWLSERFYPIYSFGLVDGLA